MQVDCFMLQNGGVTASCGCRAVDKQLDIHSTRCAKAPVLEARSYLSHNLPEGIPSFYRDFQGSQVFDLVGKMGLIHKKNRRLLLLPEYIYTT
jgi:hypothetical protein